MTKRDFFRMIIKLFGLYSLILTVFTYIPKNISYVTSEFEPITLLWVLGFVTLTALIYIFLIRNTDLILNKLKIDEGFDDDRIEFTNFDSQKILQLALILIGGLLIIDNFPDFLQYTYLTFKKEVSHKGPNIFEKYSYDKTKDYLGWAISVVNLIVGYVLLTNYNSIIKWLDRKGKNE